MWDDPTLGHYIAGQADADSCFHIALKPRPVASMPYTLQPSWQVDKLDDREILETMMGYIGVGNIQTPKRNSKLQDGRRHRLIVNGFASAQVVSFFEKFPLRSAKKRRDYLIWKQAVEIYCARKDHEPWTKDQALALLDLKEKMGYRLKGRGMRTDAAVNFRRFLEASHS